MARCESFPPFLPLFTVFQGLAEGDLNETTVLQVAAGLEVLNKVAPRLRELILLSSPAADSMLPERAAAQALLSQSQDEHLQAQLAIFLGEVGSSGMSTWPDLDWLLGELLPRLLAVLAGLPRTPRGGWALARGTRVVADMLRVLGGTHDLASPLASLARQRIFGPVTAPNTPPLQRGAYLHLQMLTLEPGAFPAALQQSILDVAGKKEPWTAEHKQSLESIAAQACVDFKLTDVVLKVLKETSWGHGGHVKKLVAQILNALAQVSSHEVLVQQILPLAMEGVGDSVQAVRMVALRTLTSIALVLAHTSDVASLGQIQAAYDALLSDSQLRFVQPLAKQFARLIPEVPGHWRDDYLLNKVVVLTNLLAKLDEEKKKDTSLALFECYRSLPLPSPSVLPPEQI